MMTSDITASVAETLRAAGHTEARGDGAGFFAVADGCGKVIVVADLGAHAEGHFDSDGQRSAQAREVGGYGRALTAAGWPVKVGQDGAGLVVSQRAKGA